MSLPRKISIAPMPLALVVAAALLGASLIAPARADQADKDKPVTKMMEQINHNYKTLSREARHKKFDDQSLKLVMEMEDLALKCMHEDPPMAEKPDKVPPAKKAQFILEYRKAMAQMVSSLMDLEIALRGNNADLAKELVEKLKTEKTDGHAKFTEE